MARYRSSHEEHLAARSCGALVDAHSMGKVVVEGRGAAALLDKAATADIAGLRVGGARYSCLCSDDGGILDDVIVYRTDIDSFYLITNTLSRERVFGVLRSMARGAVHVTDVTSAVAYFAVQGPASRELLARAGVTEDLTTERFPYFSCAEVKVANVTVLLARTGYTGELGYELNFPAEYALDVWDRFANEGAAIGIAPIGGEAMMSLRLEKGYRSYGTDIDTTVTPLEAGLSWAIDWRKPSFIGREALLAQRQRGRAKRMVCLKAEEGVEIHPGAALLSQDGAVVGRVTSGMFGPSLGTWVALAFLDASVACPGPVQVGGGMGGPAQCSDKPFFDPAGERLRS